MADSVSSMRAIPRLVVELDGIAGSPGLSIGQALVVEVRRPGVVKRRLAKHQAADEVERYRRVFGTAGVTNVPAIV